MKKFVSILLVLVLMMSLSVAAFASEVEVPAEASPAPTTATLAKVVTVTNDGTTMPAQTFSFEVTRDSVTDAAEGVNSTNMPLPSVDSVTYAEGEYGSKPLTIHLPTYTSVGVYIYNIKEVAGSTAGMVYDTTTLKLKVTVINGTTEGTFVVAGTALVGAENKKSDSFNNEYQANSLTVEKEVKGNLGDKSKEFTATVTFTSSKEVKSTITGAAEIKPDNWTYNKDTGIWTASANITIKHGAVNNKTFNNIPAGVSYSVAEIVGADGKVDGKYVVSYDSNKEGVITANAAASTTITNTYGNDNLDLGVSMDSLPYILMLVVVGAAVVVIATRKKGEQF